jgi:hypothetical protein
MKDRYFLLFNNLPDIEKVNGKKVAPAEEKLDNSACDNGFGAQVYPPPKKDSKKPDYAPGEVLIKLKEHSPKGILDRINRVYGTKFIKHLSIIDVYLLRIPINRSAEIYVKILPLSPHVGYAELNREMHIQ